MLNQVTFIGRVGADPEARYTANGTLVCNLRVGATRFYNDAADKRQEETTWMQVVVWAKQADFVAQYVRTGHLVAITGRIQNRQWQNAEGVTQYRTEIVADQVQSLTTKAEAEQLEARHAPNRAKRAEDTALLEAMLALPEEMQKQLRELARGLQPSVPVEAAAEAAATA